MAELADALDLGSSAARREGSTPFTRTKFKGNSMTWRCLKTDPPTGNEYAVLLFPLKSDCGVLYTVSNPHYARGQYALDSGYTHWCNFELAPDHDKWEQWQLDLVPEQ